MRIIAIDPGLRCTGLAWTQGAGPMPMVASVRPQTRSIRDKAREIAREIPDVCWDILVIEKPQVYQGAQQKGDPNDLIALAILVGNLEALISTYNVHEVLPTTWKHQVPKHIHHTRILARAGIEGRFSKDALDALGLLQYAQDVAAAELVARRAKRPR